MLERNPIIEINQFAIKQVSTSKSLGVHNNGNLFRECDINEISKNRVVTKISSCRVNTTSRRGIKWLGISFGSIFLLFSNKSSREPLSW